MSFEFDICLNYAYDENLKNLHIGYSKSSGVLFIIIPTLSIITNLFVIITYLKRKMIQKNQ